MFNDESYRNAVLGRAEHKEDEVHEVDPLTSLQHQVKALVLATGEQTFAGAMVWIGQQRRLEVSNQPNPRRMVESGV